MGMPVCKWVPVSPMSLFAFRCREDARKKSLVAVKKIWFWNHVDKSEQGHYFQPPFVVWMRQSPMHFYSKSGIRVDRIGWEVDLDHNNTLWLN